MRFTTRATLMRPKTAETLHEHSRQQEGTASPAE